MLHAWDFGNSAIDEDPGIILEVGNGVINEDPGALLGAIDHTFRIRN